MYFQKTLNYRPIYIHLQPTRRLGFSIWRADLEEKKYRNTRIGRRGSMYLSIDSADPCVPRKLEKRKVIITGHSIRIYVDVPIHYIILDYVRRARARAKVTEVVRIDIIIYFMGGT